VFKKTKPYWISERWLLASPFGRKEPLTKEAMGASRKNIIGIYTPILWRGMKLNIDILMTALLIVFVVSFAAMLLYGEIWQVNLSTQGSRTPLEIGHAQIAFVASCIGIASGASLLYIMTTKFAQDDRRQNADSTSSHS
jgi:hypothetical protein